MIGLAQAQAAALARWQELGWPTTRDEAWRNFSTKALQEIALTGGITRGSVLASAIFAGLPSPRIVFVDGKFVAHLAQSVAGVSVSALESIERVPTPGAIEALNASHLGDGVAIHATGATGATGAATLHVVHIVTGRGSAHVRVVVTVESGAQLTLGEQYIGVSDDAYLMNSVVEVDLAEGAVLELGTIVNEGTAAAHLQAVHAQVGSGARLRTFTLALDGARVRTAVTVSLNGPGAEAAVDGLYLGKGRQKLDHVTDITHAVGHTTSSESWSGVLDERAEGGFQGVIRIARDAVKSATRQLTRTLLLSNDAEAHAKPELHIDCDDVTASHGATVGQLDAMEQFYLESRGIPPEDARRMLVRAFVDKQLVHVPAALRPVFDATVTDALGGLE